MVKTQQDWSGCFYNFSDRCRSNLICLSSAIQWHFENNQNYFFSQSVTHSTPSPHLKLEHFKMAKDHHPLSPTAIFKSLALTCIRLWNDTVSCISSPQANCTVHGRLSMDRVPPKNVQMPPKNGHVGSLNMDLCQQPQ